MGLGSSLKVGKKSRGVREPLRQGCSWASASGKRKSRSLGWGPPATEASVLTGQFARWRQRRSRPGLTGAVWETSPGLQQPKPRPRGPPPRGAEVGRCWGPTPGGAHRPSSPRPHPWLPPRMPTRLHPSRSPGAPAAPASRTVA